MIYSSTFKVVVVEDEPIILENIVQKIENADPAFKVLGKAINGAMALPLIHTIKPDVLFTDIKMPMMDGLELIEEVRKSYPEMLIVILSGYNDFEYAQKAIKLGVRDYLLKPLKSDCISRLLNQLKPKLEGSLSSLERNIMSSEIIGHTTTSSELPYSLGETSFVMFLICIGNLSNHVASTMQLKYFHKLWDSVNWDCLMSNLLGEAGKWWIVDERYPNKKFVVISSSNLETSNILSLATLIKEQLSKEINTLNINVCTLEESIYFTNIWTTAQKLRMLLDQSLVIGKSLVTTPEKLPILEQLPASWDIQTQNKLVFLFQQNSKKGLQQELYALFDRWNALNCPQRYVENALHRLIILLQQHTVAMSDAEIYHLEYNLNEILALCTDFRSIYQDIWNQISLMFQTEYIENSNTEELVNNIEEYIQRNFSKPLSLEDIARSFNFNPAYLTRVFKKYKGETPLKHIILLRINEAKRLMRHYPDMDIREIGEIIGYSDQHYFSRIFKNITGQTPSKFKETADIEEQKGSS